jgi:hypothetical protein
MNPFRWFLERRKQRKEDRKELRRALLEQRRAGEAVPRSQAEIVEEVGGQFPTGP